MVPCRSGIWEDGRLTRCSSVNDFALFQVAAGLGRNDDAEKYLSRSRNWRNHWNKGMSALNHSGFLGPKDTNGRFMDQDPLSCGGCYWNDHCKCTLTPTSPHGDETCRAV